jgi:hypothetical protein
MNSIEASGQAACPGSVRRERTPTTAGSVCSLSQPKSDISDFGHLRVPNSGKAEFGWERGGVRGFALSIINRHP